MKVSLSCGKLRKLTAQLFKGKRLKCLAAVFIAAVIVNAPSFILENLFSSRVLSYFLEVYMLVIAGPLALGLACSFTGLFRDGEDTWAENLVRGFSGTGRALNLFALTFVFTVLWSMLFIVPGIIAAIRYSQAFFIMADDPLASPMECISKSKQMMNGNKGKFFLLQLSYLPLALLLSVPSGIAMSAAADFSGAIYESQYMAVMEKAAADPLVSILSILTVIAVSRMLAAATCFYDIASGNLRLEFGGQIPDIQGKDSVDFYEISGFETNSGGSSEEDR